MPKKEKLIEKLCRKPMPSNFTIMELDNLMRYCDCEKHQGGRGSSIIYYHKPTGRILQFDGPHPGKELYKHHVKATINFLESIDIIKK